MTVEDLKETIEKLKKDGLDDGQIIGSMWGLFRQGKLNLDQFDAIVNTMGYHVNPDLKKMPEDKQKELDWDFGNAPKKLPEKKESNFDGEEKEEKEESEDDERKKAMKLMGYQED